MENADASQWLHWSTQKHATKPFVMNGGFGWISIMALRTTFADWRWRMRIAAWFSSHTRVGTRWLKYDIVRASTEKGMSNIFRRRRICAVVSLTMRSVLWSYAAMASGSFSLSLHVLTCTVVISTTDARRAGTSSHSRCSQTV